MRTLLRVGAGPAGDSWLWLWLRVRLASNLGSVALLRFAIPLLREGSPKASLGCHRGLCWRAAGRRRGASAASACGSLVMSVIPAHLMRSVGGGYDNESVAVTAMCLVFLLWCRSLRNDDSWPLGAAAGLAVYRTPLLRRQGAPAAAWASTAASQRKCQYVVDGGARTSSTAPKTDEPERLASSLSQRRVARALLRADWDALCSAVAAGVLMGTMAFTAAKT